MKRAALGLTAIGVLCLAANQGLAQRVVSHATATHMAAGIGVPSTAPIATLHQYRQVGHYVPAHRGHHMCGPDCGCGRGYGRPYVPHHYRVGVPVYDYYVPYTYQYYQPYQPYRGFSYYGPGFSIGIGF